MRAIRQHKTGTVAEFLDEAEDVVPSAAFKTRRVLAEFEQDFVHFESRENRFDQDRGADGAARNSGSFLRSEENIVPQPGFHVALHLGEIEVRPAAVLQQGRGVVEEVQSEIEERGGDGLAIQQYVLFVQVPAARPDEQRRGLCVQLVALTVRSGELDFTPDGIAQVDLALDQVAARSARWSPRNRTCRRWRRSSAR